MGLMKGCAKLIGSAVLITTGTASTILKGVFDATGTELGSEIFGSAKNASFNGIRKMWQGDKAQENIKKAEDASFDLEKSTRRKMAETAKKAADLAKKNGDDEKYQFYQSKYEQFK